MLWRSVFEMSAQTFLRRQLPGFGWFAHGRVQDDSTGCSERWRVTALKDLPRGYSCRSTCMGSNLVARRAGARQAARAMTASKLAIHA